LAPKKSVQLSGVVVAQTELSSIDAEQGVLMYRGYDIADLAEHATYEEVAYLLLEGELPTPDEVRAFREELSARDLPGAVQALVDGNARDASPMEMLRTAVSLLSFSDPAEASIAREEERRKSVRLIALLPTIVSRHHRLRQGLDPVAPDPALTYAENFLTMLRGSTPTDDEVRAFDIAMILHAEHELNASTFAARVVAGTQADVYSAVVAAICALKGPTHGGANQAAIGII
jgi:citrate synthase